MAKHIAFPYQFDHRGHTAQSAIERHVRDLIEQVLFTIPGERVNRPTFGSGLSQLVFAPNSDEVITATEFMVQGALQQWLSDLIQVESVRVEGDESRLFVTVVYMVRRDQRREVVRLNREEGAT